MIHIGFKRQDVATSIFSDNNIVVCGPLLDIVKLEAHMCTLMHHCVYLYFENLVIAHHKYVMQTAHLVPSTRTREFLKLWLEE
jgi:hypothetical protein